MMALRLARISTGKPRILKFLGHFHGWNDFVVPGADPPYDGGPVPGLLPTMASDTVVIPPNDADAVERALEGDSEIGAVILEPTGGHYGSVPIRGPFLRALRDITRRLGRVLIFDEVITGFRVHPGGAQGHYGVIPDVTTLAKVLAGGLPGGCVAGRADILAGLESRPGKPKMKHPGTFNANPLSAAAGIATLNRVATGEPCRRANEIGRLLRRGLNEAFARERFKWAAYGEFSNFRLIPDYDGALPADDSFVPYDSDFGRLEGTKNPKLIHGFRCAMFLNGIDLPGLGGMTMAAHREDDVAKTVAGVVASIARLQGEGMA